MQLGAQLWFDNIIYSFRLKTHAAVLLKSSHPRGSVRRGILYKIDVTDWSSGRDVATFREVNKAARAERGSHKSTTMYLFLLFFLDWGQVRFLIAHTERSGYQGSDSVMWLKSIIQMSLLRLRWFHIKLFHLNSSYDKTRYSKSHYTCPIQLKPLWAHSRDALVSAAAVWMNSMCSENKQETIKRERNILSCSFS